MNYPKKVYAYASGDTYTGQYFEYTTDVDQISLVGPDVEIGVYEFVGTANVKTTITVV